MKKAFTLVILVCISFTSFAQENSEYSNTLQKLFKISGTEETYQVAIKQMFTIFKQQYSNIDESTWKDLEKEFGQTSLLELTKMLVPVYSKHLSLEDLKELIIFYESPVGKKYAKSTPLIMKESMEVGQEWGRKIGEKFAKKMEEKGY